MSNLLYNNNNNVRITSNIFLGFASIFHCKGVLIPALLILTAMLFCNYGKNPIEFCFF